MKKDLTAKLSHYAKSLMRQIRSTRLELTEHQEVRAAREREAMLVVDAETGAYTQTDGS